MTEADVLAEQVVENAVRADLQPVEAGRAYKRLMDLNGWTAQQVAETLGVEPTAVYRALSLLKLPEDVAAQVDAGEIKATAAYEISKLQIADDQRELAQKVVDGGARPQGDRRGGPETPIVTHGSTWWATDVCRPSSATVAHGECGSRSR